MRLFTADRLYLKPSKTQFIVKRLLRTIILIFKVISLQTQFFHPLSKNLMKPYTD